MLRSFDYAAYSALARVSAERPDDFPRLEPFARAWEGETERAFLQAYEQGVAGSPLYGEWAEARDSLALFVIEKALYEVRYELQNRPEWAGIPLRGLCEAHRRSARVIARGNRQRTRAGPMPADGGASSPQRAAGANDALGIRMFASSDATRRRIQHTKGRP